MSKIEEMAEKEVPIREWDDNITIDWCRQIYCLGANAILREIEKILVAANEQYTTKQAVALNTEIYNKIKELKED